MKKFGEEDWKNLDWRRWRRVGVGERLLCVVFDAFFFPLEAFGTPAGVPHLRRPCVCLCVHGTASACDWDACAGFGERMALAIVAAASEWRHDVRRFCGGGGRECLRSH